MRPIATKPSAAPTAPMASSVAMFHGGWLALAVGVLLLACVLGVDRHGRVVIPLVEIPVPEACMFKRFTGHGCAGCGLTRCFISLAHGQFARAWRFNPAGFPLFLFVVAQIPYRAMQIWRVRHGRPEWQAVGLSTAIGIGLTAVLLAQWIWHEVLTW